MLRNGRRFVGHLFVGSASRSSISLGLKPVRSRSKSASLRLLEFQCQEFLIPRSPFHGTVDQQPERFDLGRAPFITEDYRDLGDAKLPCRLEAEVPVYDLAVAAGQHGHLESELANTPAHTIDDV